MDCGGEFEGGGCAGEGVDGGRWGGSELEVAGAGGGGGEGCAEDWGVLVGGRSRWEDGGEQILRSCFGARVRCVDELGEEDVKMGGCVPEGGPLMRLLSAMLLVC